MFILLCTNETSDSDARTENRGSKIWTPGKVSVLFFGVGRMGTVLVDEKLL